MNIQEIIESINYCLKCNNDSIPTTQEDLQTIKEALEKQIPESLNTETVNHGISVSGEYDIDLIIFARVVVLLLVTAKPMMFFTNFVPIVDRL